MSRDTIQDPILIHVNRSALVESAHAGTIVVRDAIGDVLVSVGDVNRPVFPRSAIKALQAIPLVESGAVEAFNFDNRELAVMCASHGGEPQHVALVSDILAKIGVETEALACGPHWPLCEHAGRTLAGQRREPTALHNNCSGKHAGMLALAVHAGMDIAGYEQSAHPVQRLIASTLAEMTNAPITEDLCAIDGCSVPTWGLPISSVALAMARLASGEGLDSDRASACAQLRKACMAEPWFVAGSGRFCSDVMQSFKGRVFLKEGAEGVYCGAVPGSGLGIALKIKDGAKRAAECAIAHILWRLVPDAPTILDDYRKRLMANWRGTAVGNISAAPALNDMLDRLSQTD